MTKWDVLFTATKISKGLELDLFDSNGKPADPPPQIKKYDVLNFEVTLRRTKFEGMVVEVRDNGDAIIEAQSARWRISPATDTDVVHPVKTNMQMLIWIVREQLS